MISLAYLANLPHCPGIYQMIDQHGKVLYVGKAKDLKKRVSSYFSPSQKANKIVSLIKHIDRIEVTITQSENEAILLECNLIKKYLPRYNILMRDDKTYPYIVINMQHTYPRIDLYRGTRHKNCLYFGPYSNAAFARETIGLIQKLFCLRTCRESVYRTRSRPCLLYQIGRCSGPCVQKISQEQYAQNVQSAILFLEGKNHDLIHLLKEKMDAASLAEHFEIAATYRDQMIQLRAIQEKQYVQVGSGDADIIDIEERAQMFAIQLLSMRAGCIIHSRSFPLKSPHDTTQKEAISAFISQYYLSLSSLVAENHLPKQIIVNVLPNGKRALESILTEKARHIVKIARPIRGKKLIWLKMAADSAKQALVQHTASQDAYEERWQALAQLLNVTTPLIRIECFDISHTQGESTIGSCVVFDAYGPVKRDYRYFNIVGEVGGDDLAAMHQALLRRFKRLIKTNSTLPDLLLIDGGETQLAVAHQVLSTLNLQIQLLSVSKGKARKRGEEVLHRVQMKPQRLQPDSQALHLIQYIRDEAHRFAITKHRSLRDKKRRRSRLESVPKIGPKRRQALLNYFGGIQGIARASLEELTKVPGVSRSLALDIFSVFHNETV